MVKNIADIITTIPAINSMFKANICSKVAIKAPELCYSVVAIVNFEQVDAGWAFTLVIRKNQDMMVYWGNKAKLFIAG